MKSYLPLGLALVAALLDGAPAAFSKNADFVLPSGVRIEIVEAPFKKDAFKVSGCNADSKGCLINGRIPFGNAEDLPKTYVKSIRATYQGRTHSLDASDMYDAWGDRPLEEKGVVRYFGGKCFSPGHCQFRGLFSDAGGAFVAEWQIVNGVSFRTVLTDSGDIVSLFISEIDPPEYE